MYGLRFDLRTPDPTLAQELYSTALDMAEWGDRNGCAAVTISEHHGSEDGFLPSPLLLASAVAARTRQVPIMIAALVVPLYDPVRLAEDLAVLDRLSGGRVTHVLALGYRREEYDLYGVPWEGRGRRLDEQLDVLLAALRGTELADGRRGVVTPSGAGVVPKLLGGGKTAIAARRAGRLGFGFFAQTDDPALGEAYRMAAEEHGHQPGAVMLPSPGRPTTVFVADDVDRAWAEIGPYLLHEARMYASWNPGEAATVASLTQADTVEELRAANGATRIVDVEGARELIRQDGMLSLHPLCGGIPPKLAWPYLERVVEKVLPGM